MLKQIVLGFSGLAFAITGLAKLPPPTPEQQAAATLAAAKTAHSAKVDAYETCMEQSKLADAYIKQQKAQGKTYTPEATPACANPGPFVPPTPAPAAAAAPAQAAAAPAQPAAAPVKK